MMGIAFTVHAEAVCLACRLLLPTVVFCFSKKRVDALADNLSRLDLSTASEKSEVLVPPAVNVVPTMQPLVLECPVQLLQIPHPVCPG